MAPPGPKMKCAGDQGIMFGYACNETPVFMPAPPVLCVHEVLRKMAEARHSGKVKGLEPGMRNHNGRCSTATVKLGKSRVGCGVDPTCRWVIPIGRARNRAAVCTGCVARWMDVREDKFM